MAEVAECVGMRVDEAGADGQAASIDFSPCTKSTRSRVPYKNDAGAAYSDIGTPSGAPGAINQGAVTNQDVDAVLGASGKRADDQRRRHKS